MADQLLSRHCVGELFLQASLDPTLWLTALDAMASASGSYRAQMLGIDRHGDLAFNFMTNVDDAFLASFFEISGHHEASVNYRVASSVSPGTIVFEDRYDAIRARTGPTAYEEVCEKFELPFGCQTTLAAEQGSLTGLALLRTRRDGPTTPETRAFFAAIAPKVQAAVRLQSMIEARGSELVRGALDAVHAPALLIDGFRRVIDMTPAAERTLAATSRLDVRSREIVASTPSQTYDIQAALWSVLRRERPEATVTLRGGREPPISLAIQPLPHTDWELGFRPCAIVVLKGMAAGPVDDLPQLLQSEFGLTGSEADVAVRLFACVPRAEIAEQRNSSIGTVRQQIKSIFAKLGVRREAEFMALITGQVRG